MYKLFLISGLALALAGCAAQQGQREPVQVRDLSASRADATPAEYTVKAGDTLYGIAWRHGMDYRDLARLNRIGPPYLIEPGQRLILGGEGRAAGEQGADDASTGRKVATMGRDDAPASDEKLDWLLPDESAIERNRRLSAERQAAQDAVQSSSPGAQEGAEGASPKGPGPVYNYNSPGADGTLSERDLAERRERASREAQRQAAAESPDTPKAASKNATHQVASTPSPSTVAADAGTSVAGEASAEQRAGRRYTPVEEVAWQWPASGEVVGRFGEGGSITAGIDIAGKKGQPVKAAGPGIVVYAGSGVRGYGKLILLKHNDQFLSAYAHNDSLKVKENDVVEAGEVIATMGDSDAEDVRLHFEVRKDGQPQDPLKFLPSR
ncbi:MULTISPECIES: peptidoglycan DD-metalloendopeptidase family protein [Halomonas]|uniref:LysM domain-containing protein n=1 Tax=Halomonas ventosae TaxID=229007 RepID=A0A4R6HQN8_9GAMM|nr:peptidoglycan DD-metalloendopeptidase family protein [Halomonas ventosae]TDO10625.1 LysM domain-containing protein [Halomonas ventosae]